MERSLSKQDRRREPKVCAWVSISCSVSSWTCGLSHPDSCVRSTSDLEEALREEIKVFREDT